MSILKRGILLSIILSSSIVLPRPKIREFSGYIGCNQKANRKKRRGEGEEGRGILSLFLFKTSTQPWMRNEIAPLRFHITVIVTQDRDFVNHPQR